MLGKEKCKILKEIRQRIADENDIPYVTRECRHQGDCRGTCPRCESELRYLEQQLVLRASLGKRVAVAALCAGMTLGAAGCAPQGQEMNTGGDDLSGAVAYVDTEPAQEPEVYVTTGEIAWLEETEESIDAKLPPEIGTQPREFELMGDVAWPELEENHA